MYNNKSAGDAMKVIGTCKREVDERQNKIMFGLKRGYSRIDTVERIWGFKLYTRFAKRDNYSENRTPTRQYWYVDK